MFAVLSFVANIFVSKLMITKFSQWEDDVPCQKLKKTSTKVLSDKGFSFSAIGKDIKRPRNVISNFLQDPEAYGIKKSTGNPPKLSPSVHRRVLTEASRKGINSRNLQTSLDLNVLPRRVRQILNSSKDFVYKKRITTPALTKMHKKRREEWVQEKVQWNAENWSKVIFSDEKKFNLDGSDGFQFCWHDLRKMEQIFSKCPFGVGSFMIWGAFSIKSKASLVKMEGKHNVQKYNEVSEKVSFHSWPIITGMM